MYEVLHLVADRHVCAAWPIGDQFARARLIQAVPPLYSEG